MTAKTAAPPPAYFLSLTLENVRSFGKKQTISFTRKDGRPAQWTIILGDNGVGKTTVLRSLSYFRTRKEPVPFPSAQGQELELYLPVSFPGKGEDVPFRKDGNHLLSIECALALGQNLEDAESLLMADPEPFIQVFPSASRVGQHDIAISLNSQELRGLICYGYGAGRTTGNSTLSETPEAVDTCASLFDDRADLLNPEEWFLQMEYSSLKQDKQAAKALEQVRQVLLQVLPDVTDLRISSKGHQQYLELATPYGWVRLRDMSLGYQTLVVWLTDFAGKLLSRYPNKPNPLEGPAIVLIDEIDLHLHPSWQRKLLGFLGDIFKNTQFIATAHSPLVVQAATDEGANVVLLKREDDQTIVSQNPVDVRGWRVDQILTSTFFNLETARSVATEKKMARQAALLNKEKLTPRQRRELDQLTLELEGQPMGSSSPGAEEEEEAMLRELTRRVGKRPKA